MSWAMLPGGGWQLIRLLKLLFCGLPALLPDVPGLAMLCLAMSWLAAVAACLYPTYCDRKQEMTWCLSGLLLFPSGPTQNFRG